jgi:hypothetical protein
MQLPDDSIGISDIETYRECARKASYGMRRHTGRGEQSDRRTPEADVSGAVWARSYGSAIHKVIEAKEDGWKDEDAIQQAWNEYGRFLEPADLDLLRDDLAIFKTRDFPNTRLVLAEEDIRVPLLVHEGVQIYFRAKVDRLYERLDVPGTFLHADYKSSKWLKSAQDVHNDRQLWSTNWAVHEFFPECERLLQHYDQLRGGQIPTRKTDEQRVQIRDWLEKQVRSILADENWQPDGLLPHSLNQWCPWCPILESCTVVGELTDYAATRIAALAPERPKKKADGSDSKVMEAVPLDPANIERYTAELSKAKLADKVLTRFVDSVNEILREMPAAQRADLGFELRNRNNNVFSAQAAQTLHEALIARGEGDRFYEIVRLTKAGLEENLAESESLLAEALALSERRAGTPSVVARKAA